MFNSWLKLAGLFGLAFATKWLLCTAFKIFYPFKLAPTKNLKKLAGTNWAVITGSTDGIGKAYAFELAKRGFNIVLIARNEQKLNKAVEEIKKDHRVEIKTIVFDFGTTDVNIYEEKLLKPLKKIEIGVLVNNVGCSYDYPERLDLVGLKRVSDITITNILPVVLLSASVLGKMVERKSGIVINIASAAALQTVYNWGVYSASKKFVIWLSEILRKEYAGTGIHIQTVYPMMVSTKMSRVRRSLLVPDADEYAREALNTVGHVSETSGYFWHEIQTTCYFKLAPNFMFNYLAKKDAEKTKARALRKLNNANNQNNSN